MTTKDNWIKELSEALDDYANTIYYEGDPMRCHGTDKEIMEEFIQSKLSQVEKDARENGYKEGWDDGYVSGLEKPEYINECKNKVKKAIEKTNKRLREKIKDLQKIEEGMEHTDECYIGLSLDKDCICGRNKMYFALSDLLDEMSRSEWTLKIDKLTTKRR